MTRSENLLRAYRFQCPERIPIRFGIPAFNWRRYGRELEDVVLRHPVLFPGFKRGSVDPDSLPIDPRNRAGAPYTDPWGCVYEPEEDDVPCYVSKHPLADWRALGTFAPPDPERTNGRQALDWDRIEAQARKVREGSGHVTGSLMHGHLFLLLESLRGYENLVLDMADGEPRLLELIKMVEQFSMRLVERYMALGAGVMHYPEDLGAQDRPMISPALFRMYLKPVYTRLMAPAKAGGALVHMHSDGCLWDLTEDILDCGVDVINLQDLVNGIDEIAARLKGRVAIDLDIDRQRVTVFGSPRDIDEHVREAVMKLGSPEGGLSMVHGCYSGAPLENIDALMTAMEKYSTYYA